MLDGDDVIGHAQRLQLLPTLVRLSSSRSSAPEGEALTLAARVHTLVQAGRAPTGSVLFRAGVRTLGEAPLDLVGEAVLGGVRLLPGVHAITAAYSGDVTHAAGASAPLPQAVTLAAMLVIVLVCAPCEVVDGFRLEAELVDPHTGRLAEDASGVVTFSAGGQPLGSADLVSGHARTVVSALPSGRLAVRFPGDAEHAAATGYLLA